MVLPHIPQLIQLGQLKQCSKVSCSRKQQQSAMVAPSNLRIIASIGMEVYNSPLKFK